MELFATLPGQILIGVFVTINLWAFLIMARDKRKSIVRDGSRRIPEGRMFFMATFFGSVGVLLGMLLFRHKTKKWYFKLGIPVLILQNIATVYVVWSFLSSA